VKRTLIGLFAGVLAAIGAGSMPAAASNSQPTIVGIAVHSSNLSTLTAAVVCTGLAPALSGDRHYTVFAPTDAAFARLNLTAANVCSLPHLKDILLYHVTPGDCYARSVVPRHPGRQRTIETLLADQSFQVDSNAVIHTSSGGSSQTFRPNIKASNGVIHLIDAVLIPGTAGDNNEEN